MFNVSETFELIKAISDTVIDMVVITAYHDKPFICFRAAFRKGSDSRHRAMRNDKRDESHFSLPYVERRISPET